MPQAMEQINTIIFDLGKVIVDFDHREACAAAAQHSPYSPEEIYKIIFFEGIEERFDLGQITPEQFYRQSAAATSSSVDQETCRRIWTHIFSLNSGIEELIAELKKKYRLVCLSNTNVWHFQYCRKTFPVLERFDGFVLSYEVGVKKPHPAIFHAALEAARAAPDRCFYIDDVRDFIHAAGRLGIRGVTFESVEQVTAELHRLGIL